MPPPPTATAEEVAAPNSAAALQALTSNRVPRVLLIRRRYLGDIVLLGSVLRNLRLHWPSAWISVLTETAYSGVVRLNPDVDSAFTFPHRAAEWFSFVRALRRV